MGFYNQSGQTRREIIEEELRYGDEAEVINEAINILNNAKTIDITHLIKIFRENTNIAKVVRENVEKLSVTMDWFTMKELLQFEGIDKDILCEKFLNDCENLLSKNDTVFIKVEDVYYTISANNANEWVKIIKEFIESEQVSPEHKKEILIKLEENFEKIVENASFDMETLMVLQELGISKQKILLQKDKIIRTIDAKDIPTFYSYCKENNNEIVIDFDEYLSLILKGLSQDTKSKDAEIAIWTIKKVIHELSEYQGLNPFNIKHVGEGTHSDAFKIGEYVVKLGTYSTNTSQVPYSKYIIQPILRQKLKMGLYIEVQNLADTTWYQGLSEEEIEEELFKLYANLRREGVEWKDIRKENVGRLLKPNSPNLNIDYYVKNSAGEMGKVRGEITVTDEMSQFTPHQESENDILQAGELVIIDIDFLGGRGVLVPRTGLDAELHSKCKNRYESQDR